MTSPDILYMLSVCYLVLRDHIISYFVVNPRHRQIFPSRFAVLEDALISV